MSHRYPRHHSQQPSYPPSGLLRAVMQTGRQRGDSATPAPILSPNPNRNLQGAVNRMESNTGRPAFEAKMRQMNITPPNSDDVGGVPLSPTPQVGNGRKTVGGEKMHIASLSKSLGRGQGTGGSTNTSFSQGHSSNDTTDTQNRSFSHQPKPSTSAPKSSGRERDFTKMSQRFYEATDATPPITLAFMSTEIQKRLSDLQNRINRMPGLDQNTKVALWNDIALIEGEFDRLQSDVQKGIDQSKLVADKFYDSLLRVRDDVIRIRFERDECRGKIAKQQHEIDELRVKVYIDQRNPEEAAERKKNEYFVNSFGTPSFDYAAFQDSGFYQSKMAGGGTPLTKEALAANKPIRKPGERPQRPVEVNQPATYGGSERKSPKENPHPQQALALYDPVEKFKAGFSEVFALAESWVRNYTRTPNDRDHNLVTSDPKTFEYLLNLTYAHARRDAISHTLDLLGSESTRMWFIMRVLISYIATEILASKAWKGFNTATNTAIDESNAELAQRGLANEARQRCVEKIHKAVAQVTKNASYDKFRQVTLNLHSKALRDLVGPFLNDAGDRTAAGKDLGKLVVTSWEFSAKLNTSFLTFNIHFPELTGKYIAGSMIAMDRKGEDPSQLQIDQTRLRLVITPIVTLRDDRGSAIRAKNLHNALVLTQVT